MIQVTTVNGTTPIPCLSWFTLHFLSWEIISLVSAKQGSHGYIHARFTDDSEWMLRFEYYNVMESYLGILEDLKRIGPHQPNLSSFPMT